MNDIDLSLVQRAVAGEKPAMEQLGRVTPGVTNTDTPLDLPAPREHMTHIGTAIRVVAYYRADPASKPRRDLVRLALQPFEINRSN
jgi:hypothetical protein